MISELVEKVLQSSVETDGLDSTLTAFAEIRDHATIRDLPLLLEALRSDRSNFWVREMLAEPIAALGGPAVLPDLLRAFQTNIEEGHDNDTFSHHLIELVEEQPVASAAILRSLQSINDNDLQATAAWLLEFTNSAEG
jgi:hypothetical protein